MSVKLSSPPADNAVTAFQMKDGQLGQIVDNANYNGRIVQKLCAEYSVTSDTLFTIGERNGQSWSDIKPNSPSLRIRLLQPGETIEVVNN